MSMSSLVDIDWEIFDLYAKIQGVSEFDTYFFITGTPIKTTPYVKISVRQFVLIKELEQF